MSHLTKEKLFWYIWSKNEKISYKETAKVIHRFGSLSNAFSQSCYMTMSKEKFSPQTIHLLQEKLDLNKERCLYERMEERGVQFVTYEEEEYPSRLLNMYDPPWFLYYKGELPRDDYPSVAIIGARNCTGYGKDMACKIAEELARAKCQIISGLAAGIDSFAHAGALKGKGNTFGVIGNGVDICYPSENYRIYEKMATAGGILSEYPLGSKPLPYHFPIRNRIIAGLSDGIFVIEAKEKSGTLITVDSALEQGKDIYALPGRITDENSLGCNSLIQNGAKLITGSKDIITEFAEKFPSLYSDKTSFDQGTMALCQEFSKNEELVLQAISYEPVHIDKIKEQTGFSLAVVLETVFDLQMKGVISEVSSQRYIMHIT